jgi:hypothetical protein
MIRGKRPRKKNIPPLDKDKTIALIKRNRKKYDNGERLKLKMIVNVGKDGMRKAKTEEQKLQWAIWANEFNKDLLQL